MYNGIGLYTVRGSGTNGFVTRNLSSINHKKERVDYKDETQVKYDFINKEPNQGLIQHERKRKIELKCMEMKVLMEDQGYNESEIDNKVSQFREMLIEKEGMGMPMVEVDDIGRPTNNATHILAAAKQAQNDKLRNAFGIGDHYVEGAAMDPDRKEKEALAKKMAAKKYSMLAPSSGSSSDSETEEQPKKAKKSKSSSEPSSHKKHKKSDKDKKSKKSHKHKKKSSKRSSSEESTSRHRSSKSSKKSSRRKEKRRSSSERSRVESSSRASKRSRSPRERSRSPRRR